MSTNPYEAPKSETTRDLPPPSPERIEAQRNVRISLLILLVPAIYNFVCFSTLTSPARAALPIHVVYRAINGAGFAIIVLAIWVFGLIALEFLTAGFDGTLARHSKLTQWKGNLYAVLRRAPVLAVFGAILWAIWVAAFYQWDVDFYTVSVPVGILGHLLAAGLYLPLFYRWYVAERTSRAQMAR